MTAAPAAPPTSSRPWRLRAYTGTTKATQKLVVDEKCSGDERLDQALKRVEARRDVTRYTVEQLW